MPPKTKWMFLVALFDFVLLTLLLLGLSHKHFLSNGVTTAVAHPKSTQTTHTRADSAQIDSAPADSTQADSTQADSTQENSTRTSPAQLLSDSQEDKKIALTFDDGPHPYYTEQLLDGLKDRGVIVTFFVTGEHAKLHPLVISRMQEEGHLIGNHTYSHLQLTKKNRAKFKQELIDTNKVISDITGEAPSYVRPPYGSWDKSFEKELNMIPVLWTVDPLDWCSDNVACITSNVITKVEENDIILMHDYYESSVTAALEIVDQLLEEGYVFVTVEEILFE